jgi:hypothetical protein
MGYAVDNRKLGLLSYSQALVGGGWFARLGYFGRSQAEGAASCREPVPPAAVAGAGA